MSYLGPTPLTVHARVQEFIHNNRSPQGDSLTLTHGYFDDLVTQYGTICKSVFCKKSFVSGQANWLRKLIGNNSALCPLSIRAHA